MRDFRAAHHQVPELTSHFPLSPSSPSRPPARQLPRYQLILHREGLNDLMDVVRTIMELTRFPRAEATHKMWQAYHRGRSLLFVTHLERAEWYAERFQSQGLIVTIEKV